MPAPAVTSPPRLSPFTHPQLKGELRLTPTGLQQWDGGQWVQAIVPAANVDLQGLSTATFAVSKLKIGSSALAGTNYVDAANISAAESHLGNSTWLTVGFDTIIDQAGDDGTLYTAGLVPFQVPVSGLWMGQVALPFASTNTTGYRGVRWISNTGLILAQPPLSLASAPSGYLVSATFVRYIVAGAYTPHVECFSSAGASVAITGDAPITPNRACFARIG